MPERDIEDGQDETQAGKDGPNSVSDDTLMILLVAGMLLAFGLGVWIGLGYPGLYDKYERTGKASRRSPLGSLVDRLTGGVGRRAPPPARRGRDRRPRRRTFLGDRNGHDGSR